MAVVGEVVAAQTASKESGERTVRDGHVSMGADTRSERSEQIRALSSLLQRPQCGVALDALGESGSSFRTEFVKVETAGVRCRGGC